MNELNDLRILVDLRNTIQKSRIAFSNRLDAIERGVDDAGEGTCQLFNRWFERLYEIERGLDEDMATVAKTFPIIELASNVKGCSFINVSKVVAHIDIERAETVSALWRYAGYAVIDGQREKLVKGEKAHFNRRLKTACWVVGGNFLKANSPYRDEYDKAREFYAVHRPEWTKGHQHNAAMGKMIKLWLSHLWEAWRELEGLPTRRPYILEKGEHTTFKHKEDYGWP